MSEIEDLRAELEKTKRAAVTLGQIIDRQCLDVLDITGLHHMVDEDRDGDWGAIWDILRDQATKGQGLQEAQAKAWEQGARTAFYSNHTGSDSCERRTAFTDHDWDNPYRRDLP